MKTILDTEQLELEVWSDEFREDFVLLNEEEPTDEFLINYCHDITRDELDYLAHEFNNFIKRYEERYKTSVVDLVFKGKRSSHYGAIGGSGASVGYRLNGTDLSDMYYGNADHIQYSINDDGKLQLVTFDHDGYNCMEIILITQRDEERFDGSYYDDIREYLDDRPKNSVKLDKKFKSAFGA